MEITYYTQGPSFEVVEHDSIDLDDALGKIRSLPLPETDVEGETCPPLVGFRNETDDWAFVARLDRDQFFICLHLSDLRIEKQKEEGTQEDAKKVIQLFFQNDK